MSDLKPYVIAEACSIEEIEQKVAARAAEGYVVQGGVALAWLDPDIVLYAQAMVPRPPRGRQIEAVPEAAAKDIDRETPNG